MPYILRDNDGKICKVSVRQLHGGESLPYSHPEIVKFLQDNGQDPSVVESSLADLRRTDGDMSRAVEDVVVALLKKNVLKMTDLPEPVRERMAYRVKLRMIIQDTFDKASQSNAA